MWASFIVTSIDILALHCMGQSMHFEIELDHFHEHKKFSAIADVMMARRWIRS